MCEFWDDFNDGFMDEDSVEDNLDEDLEMDEPPDGDSECANETDQPESDDDELTVEPFLIGGAMGYAFGEALEERRRKKRKKSDDELD